MQNHQAQSQGPASALNGQRPQGAPASAHTWSRVVPEAARSSSPSFASCCGPPASPASGSSCSGATIRIPNTYLGPGKIEELKAELAGSDANLVACDDELSPRQERNLEAALGLPVIDRTAIILDIFASHAHTAEGKLQVELAQLEYNLARMRGLWSHLERLGAGGSTAASAPADPVRPRSRPTAGSRATGSRRSSESSRTSARAAR